jgi:hypothetical protein
MQVFGMSLLEKVPLTSKRLLESLYSNTTNNNQLKVDITSTDYSNGFISSLNKPEKQFLDLIQLELPMNHKSNININSQDSLIVPQLEVLGIDKFLFILTAILTEKRIIFISTEVETLSNGLLAFLSCIQPFTWQSLYLPLCPTKLLIYTSAPVPYLIGIRRYQLPYLNKNELGKI